MADDNYEEKYTKPDLRRQIKQDLMESDKGGEPGQWSARKSQMLVQEYEKQGGGYKDDEKDDAAKSLQQWTKNEWETSDGDAAADGAEGMARYLPHDAWALLTEAGRKQANKTKKKTDDDGDQYADWPDIVQRTMAEIGVIDGDGLTKEELMDRAQELDVAGRSSMNKDELKKAIIDTYSEKKDNDLSGKTKDELYDMAQDRDVDGRSNMNKDELIKALKEDGK
ncbi:Rho termination factor N-terminal domain-containing protein [Lewinella sp. IMCC34191]|uniref:Rho termination factor N-terminal domain-containing protein n=1 Tax=Lewinella sp. IMCC34191 TaxID=2259172 RepID=UPI000E281046|nr:Rho termination factor N-terminal domain-containing protein [Lewinella sp. IMCC34191]